MGRVRMRIRAFGGMRNPARGGFAFKDAVVEALLAGKSWSSCLSVALVNGASRPLKDQQ